MPAVAPDRVAGVAPVVRDGLPGCGPSAQDDERREAAVRAARVVVEHGLRQAVAPEVVEREELLGGDAAAVGVQSCRVKDRLPGDRDRERRSRESGIP